MAPNNKSREKAEYSMNGDTSRHLGLPDEMLCGMGPFKPVFMQSCARMGCFVGVYSMCGLLTSILSMYIISQITTIEKAFGLNSSQSGFLMSCNDIGFLLTTVFFSYIARKVHIPRVLWICTVLYGVAGLVCSLAYFIARDYFLEQSQGLFQLNPLAINDTTMPTMLSHTPMCNVPKAEAETTYDVIGLNSSICDVNKFSVGGENKFSKIAMIIIAIGMIIQGLGKAPRHSFLTTYIDDNVTKKNTAMYMGIIAGVGIFGPAVAFALGGVFSRTYVTLEDVPISPRHPSWVGAWWVGFVIFGICAIVLSFPLMFFPRRMKPKPIYDRRPKSERSSSFVSNAKGFLKCIRRLVTNPIYVALLISTCVTLFSVAGSIAFSAKYLETQFFIPAWKANILLGVMNIVAASAGTIIGGFIVTKKKLSPLACTKMIIIANIISICQNCLAFFLGCGNADIVGYNTDSSAINGTNASCSDTCGCDSSTYFPICGSDNVNYMSPCHAGCTSQEGMDFRNCSCIGVNGTARPALCGDSGCIMLYPFLVISVLGNFIATLTVMPLFIAKLRSVSEADKSMAVGFSSFFVTLTGWLAGPVVFGMIVDTTCQLWSSSCSGKGACALYDNDDLRIKKHVFELVPKFIVFCIYIFVYMKARVKTDWSTDQPDRGEAEADEPMMKGSDVTEMATTPNHWKADPIYKGNNSKSAPKSSFSYK